MCDCCSGCQTSCRDVRARLCSTPGLTKMHPTLGFFQLQSQVTPLEEKSTKLKDPTPPCQKPISQDTELSVPLAQALLSGAYMVSSQVCPPQDGQELICLVPGQVRVRAAQKQGTTREGREGQARLPCGCMRSLPFCL